MQILPVLDLMQGQIVRGIAGRRDDYRPIVSQLTDSAESIAVARAFRTHLGCTEVYLADLDAIVQGRPSLDVYRALQGEGMHLWLDAGIRTCDDSVVAALAMMEHVSIVVGLESIAGPIELARILASCGAHRIVFSLDLKAGKPLGHFPGDAWEIAQCALEEVGIRRMIVLDLRCVGVGAGIGTEDLCARLKQSYPEVQLTAGGGVRGIDDLLRLQRLGLDYALVASALHDGRITRADVMRL